MASLLAGLFDVFTKRGKANCIHCHTQSECYDLGDGEHICPACWYAYIPTYREELDLANRHDAVPYMGSEHRSCE